MFYHSKRYGWWSEVSPLHFCTWALWSRWFKCHRIVSSSFLFCLGGDHCQIQLNFYFSYLNSHIFVPSWIAISKENPLSDINLGIVCRLCFWKSMNLSFSVHVWHAYNLCVYIHVHSTLKVESVVPGFDCCSLRNMRPTGRRTQKFRRSARKGWLNKSEWNSELANRLHGLFPTSAGDSRGISGLEAEHERFRLYAQAWLCSQWGAGSTDTLPGQVSVTLYQMP